MTCMVVRFDRISRVHDPAPLHVCGVTGPHDDRLLEAVLRHVRGRVGSEFVQVWINDKQMRGYIQVGAVHCAGHFTLTDVADLAAPACEVCGCTAQEGSQCVAATGAPCRWVDLGGSALICSRCADALPLAEAPAAGGESA